MNSSLTWLQKDQNTVVIKVAILAAMLAAVWWVWRYQRREAGRGLQVMSVTLGLLSFLSVAAYFWFGNFRQQSYVNYYDVMNYYLGSKYHDELGYSTLYAAVALADMEGEQIFRVSPQIRDLHNLRRVPRASAAAEGPGLVRTFGAERWADFKKDVEWYGQRSISKARILVDMGHNGTPFWSAWAGELFNRLPDRSELVVSVLASVDLVLLVVMFFVIGRTLGPVPMWLALILFCTTYSLHAWTIRGSLFRFDWLVAMGIGVCMLHRQHYKTAGALFAYATLVRVFPLVFAFGLGVKTLQSLVWERKWPSRYGQFWASFSLSSLLMIGGSALHAGGLHQWAGFVSKMDDHSSHISPKRWGVAYAGLFEHDKLLNRVESRYRAWNKDHTRWWIAVGAVVLAGVVALRMQDDETPALGVFLMFFCMNATWYYYCVLLVAYLVLVMRLERVGNVVGLWLMIAMTIGAYVIHHEYKVEILRHTSIANILLLVIPLFVLSLYLATWERLGRIDGSESKSRIGGAAAHPVSA